MNVTIRSRKLTDRGGYACMPLKQNVPKGRADWKSAVCPNCGRECWEMPLLKVAKAQEAIALCTECAIRKGVANK